MRAYNRALAFLSLAVRFSCVQGLQLFTEDSLPEFSSQCLSAMTANLSCQVLEVGTGMYQLTANISSETLEAMCTDECRNSIASYRKTVETACADDEYDDSGNSTSATASTGIYRPIVLADYYFTNYDQRCLQDSDGKY